MEVTIRKAVPDDLPRVLGLLAEFAAYEGLSQYVEITGERLHAAMFGERSVVEGLIALDDGRPVGYSLFIPTFSSFPGQTGLYIEDLFVTADARGKGVGEAMLRKIARIAAERGCERIDFLVDVENEGAIAFYERLGAITNKGDRHFKFVDKAFSDLAEPQ